jgi:hypothetical protein
VGALLRPPPRELDGLASARLRYGLCYATLFAPDRFTRASWAEPASARRGGRRLEQNIRLLDPTPLASRAEGPRADLREAAREQLGLQPDDCAIALLADPPAAADVARFAFLLGLLFTTGARVVGLARRGGTHSRRATRFVRMHGRRWGLEFTDQPTESFLAASDAAVWDVASPEPGGVVSAGALSIGRALAMGVPIAAARHPLSVELLGATHPEFLARNASLSALAERLLTMRRPAAAGTAELITPNGATQPARSAGRPGDTFASELRRLWEEVTNTPVRRPGLPVPIELRARLEGAA